MVPRVWAGACKACRTHALRPSWVWSPQATPITCLQEDLNAMKAGWRTQGITGPAVHLPFLIPAVQHLLWVLKVTHSGSDLDTAMTMARGCLPGDLQWDIDDLLTNRNEWWVPGKIVNIRERLAPVWRGLEDASAARSVLLLVRCSSLCAWLQLWLFALVPFVSFFLFFFFPFPLFLFVRFVRFAPLVFVLCYAFFVSSCSFRPLVFLFFLPLRCMTWKSVPTTREWVPAAWSGQQRLAFAALATRAQKFSTRLVQHVVWEPITCT
jgi:hypothetical protein